MRVLVIDDNNQIAKMLTTALNLEGIDCVSCTDGKEGLSLIENEKFDVVLLDLAMPEFSGYDIIDDLEKNGTLKKSKVIVFTASSVNKDVFDKLLKKGVYSYIKKPVNLDELIEKIKN